MFFFCIKDEMKETLTIHQLRHVPLHVQDQPQPWPIYERPGQRRRRRDAGERHFVRRFCWFRGGKMGEQKWSEEEMRIKISLKIELHYTLSGNQHEAHLYGG